MKLHKYQRQDSRHRSITKIVRYKRVVAIYIAAANQVAHGLVVQNLQLKDVSHRDWSLTEYQCLTNFALLSPRRPSVAAQCNATAVTSVKPTVLDVSMSGSLGIHGTQAMIYTTYSWKVRRACKSPDRSEYTGENPNYIIHCPTMTLPQCFTHNTLGLTVLKRCHCCINVLAESSASISIPCSNTHPFLDDAVPPTTSVINAVTASVTAFLANTRTLVTGL